MVPTHQTTDIAVLRAQKSQLRERMKRLRADASHDLGNRPSEQIAEHGLAFLERPGDIVISAYMAMADELDPAPLVDRLVLEGMQIALPVVIAKGEPLVFRLWQRGDVMASGTWGIGEPLADKPELLPDIMLVPLLAFDAAGGRLGYGGGFYDRTIADLRGRRAFVTVGLALDVQEVDAVPMGPHDQYLNWVLTPSGARRCGGS